jgi:hypothetical protein
MSDFGLSMIAYAGWIAAMGLALAIELARQAQAHKRGLDRRDAIPSAPASMPGEMA